MTHLCRLWGFNLGQSYGIKSGAIGNILRNTLRTEGHRLGTHKEHDYNKLGTWCQHIGNIKIQKKKKDKRIRVKLLLHLQLHKKYHKLMGTSYEMSYLSSVAGLKFEIAIRGRAITPWCTCCLHIYSTLITKNSLNFFSCWDGTLIKRREPTQTLTTY